MHEKQEQIKDEIIRRIMSNPLVLAMLDRMSENRPIGGSRKAELEQTPYEIQEGSS